MRFHPLVICEKRNKTFLVCFCHQIKNNNNEVIYSVFRLLFHEGNIGIFRRWFVTLSNMIFTLSIIPHFSSRNMNSSSNTLRGFQFHWATQSPSGDVGNYHTFFYFFCISFNSVFPCFYSSFCKRVKFKF